ncbi:MAG: MotA/TolQ/ExbB proton channel family protein [Nitrospinae bacterium]|nr:MotA/TolQ/ExbB proton channel family protein [Nitrospinota bacterium]
MSTILGIIIGISLLFVAIFVEGGGIGYFINPASMMIVIGGVIAAIFIGFPLPRVMGVFRAAAQAFRADIQQPSWVIGLIVRLAVKARQQSLLALEGEADRINNRFIRLGLEMVIDGQPSDLIRDVLDTELDVLQVRHRAGGHILRTAAKLSPAFGLIGTLIGLISMLRSLGAEAGMGGLGKGMAISLVSTFYGVMGTNLLFLPLAEKLRSRTDDEVLRTKIITEGILMLQAGANPRVIERKLNSFLPPDLRMSHYEKIIKKMRVETKTEESEEFV